MASPLNPLSGEEPYMVTSLIVDFLPENNMYYTFFCIVMSSNSPVVLTL